MGYSNKCANSSYASTSGQSIDTTKPAATGVNTLSATSAVDKQCNIYDMAGNVMEWTTESSIYSGIPCGFHGGFYGYTLTTSSRRSVSTTVTGDDVGFRLLLYL